MLSIIKTCAVQKHIRLIMVVLQRGRVTWCKVSSTNGSQWGYYSLLVFGASCQKLWMYNKQECIPVGCVPAAHWPYAGVCFPGGGLPGPGGSLVPGGSAWSGGVSALSRGVACPVCGGGSLVPGGSAWSRGGLPGSGGGSAWSGGGLASQHALRQIPPMDRITDACKNITLAQLRCGR